MENHYNVIVIGAGHNGLVAAAYLAKAKQKVLVLERRPIVGGSVVTESFGEDFTVDSVWTGGTLRSDIVKDLKLDLPQVNERPPFISLARPAESGTYGDSLVIDPDSAKTAESIKRFSEKDAGRWGEFVQFMEKAARLLDITYATIMPRLPKNFTWEEGYGLLELGLDLRLMGRRDMLHFIRTLPMTVQEFTEEYFESEQVKAALASVAVHGSTLGPMSAGTGYTLIHNWLNRGGLAQVNVGKAGEITRVLADAVQAYGGEIRVDTEVARIQVDTYTCKGVVLANGEEISADRVISAVDPKRTFLSLVGPMNLPPEFVWNVQSIKMRGSVAKVHLLTDGNHGVPEGTVVLAPSIKYLEKAYDAAKYGEISEQPYLQVTSVPIRESATRSVVSIHFQFAPYSLKNGNWDDQHSKLENLAVDSLAEYFPRLKSSIVNRKLFTPKDLEDIYGLTEGDLNHGQLMLDQFLFMRPIPGWSNHKTLIDNLYLCGSGVHGGGGVSGAAGRNVVRALKG